LPDKAKDRSLRQRLLDELNPLQALPKAAIFSF